MERTLRSLISSARAASDALNGEEKEELIQKLHHDRNLPDKELLSLASEAVSALREVSQLLEPASLILADHFLGYVSSKCLAAAVKQGVPDALAIGPKTLAQLAAETGSRADRLEQIMRMIYNNGVFAYDETTGLYSHNHISELLVSTHWAQWHTWVDLYCDEFYDMARCIPEAIPAGVTRVPAQINWDTDMDTVSYFTHSGMLPKVHRTLGNGAIAQAPGILRDYPWHEMGSVLDIGGGGGALIASLLREYPQMRGALLDIPSVIAHVTDFFHSPDGKYKDVGDRIPKENLIIGNFFKEIPRFEYYVIRWCLHDWNDDAAATILRNIREAIIPGETSRLVVLESILRDGYPNRLSRYADINMMLTIGGKERTEEQWRDLADRTGWDVVGIYELRGAWPSAIDLRPKV